MVKELCYITRNVLALLKASAELLCQLLGVWEVVHVGDCGILSVDRVQYYSSCCEPSDHNVKDLRPGNNVVPG